MKKNPFLALKSRYMVLGTYLIASVVLGVVYSTLAELPWLPGLQEDSISIPILSIAIWTVMVGAILLVGRSQGLKLKFLFGAFSLPSQFWFTQRSIKRPFPGFFWVYGALLVASLLIFSLGSFSVVFYLLSLGFPDYATTVLEDTLLLGGGNSSYPQLYNGLMLFLLIVYAPLVEELVFRGILLQRWAAKWGLRWGIVLSSLLFGLLHVNNPLGLTLFGFAMGLLYVRSRSLWVPIIFHALNNLAAVMIDAASKVGGSEPSYTVADVQNSLGVGLLMMLVTAPFLTRFVWRNWPQSADEIPYVVNFGRMSSGNGGSNEGGPA